MFGHQRFSRPDWQSRCEGPFVQSYTRHQLKEDRFQEVTRGAIGQAQAHRQQLTLLGVIVLVVAVAAGAFAYWRSQQDDQASAAMGQAMTTYTAPVRAEGTPVDPTQLSFTSAEQRDKEAEKQFQDVAEKYPHTGTGKNALYMAAVAALDAGHYSDAEAKFKKAADVGGKDLAALSKLGLASVCEATNRDQDAINLYNEL